MLLQPNRIYKFTQKPILYLEETPYLFFSVLPKNFLLSSDKKIPNSAALRQNLFFAYFLSHVFSPFSYLVMPFTYLSPKKKNPWGFASFPVRAKGEGEPDRLSRNVWIEAFILGEQSLLVWNSYGIRTGWSWRKVNRIPNSQVKKIPQYSVLQQLI
jgi:hypothetical protein